MIVVQYKIILVTDDWTTANLGPSLRDKIQYHHSPYHRKWLYYRNQAAQVHNTCQYKHKRLLFTLKYTLPCVEWLFLLLLASGKDLCMHGIACDIMVRPIIWFTMVQYMKMYQLTKHFLHVQDKQVQVFRKWVASPSCVRHFVSSKGLNHEKKPKKMNFLVWKGGHAPATPTPGSAYVQWPPLWLCKSCTSAIFSALVLHNLLSACHLPYKHSKTNVLSRAVISSVAKLLI